MDWRRALDVYVAGRNRFLTAEEKVDMTTPGSSGVRLRRGASTAEPRDYGVDVPAELDFYRNASTWRSGLPGEGTRGDASPGH